MSRFDMWKKKSGMEIKYPSELQTSKEILPALALVEFLIFHTVPIFNYATVPSQQFIFLIPFFFFFFLLAWSPIPIFKEF